MGGLMQAREPMDGGANPKRQGSRNKRGKRGSAGIAPGDPVRAGSDPRLASQQARSETTGSVGARRAVLTALERVLPLTDIPHLLWWVGTARPEALWHLEDLGCELGEHMTKLGAGFDDALSRFTRGLALANEKRLVSGDSLGPRPIWAFWSLFSRRGEPESPLSALLREEVGYPTDAEARVSSSPADTLVSARSGEGGGNGA